MPCEEEFHASDLTRFLGISFAFVSWRLLMTGIFLLVGLTVFLVIGLTSLLLPNKTKKGAAFWCLLALFCVAVVEAEGAYWMLADMPVVLFAWKAVADISQKDNVFTQPVKSLSQAYCLSLPKLRIFLCCPVFLPFELYRKRARS